MQLCARSTSNRKQLPGGQMRALPFSLNSCKHPRCIYCTWLVYTIAYPRANDLHSRPRESTILQELHFFNEMLMTEITALIVDSDGFKIFTTYTAPRKRNTTAVLPVQTNSKQALYSILRIATSKKKIFELQIGSPSWFFLMSEKQHEMKKEQLLVIQARYKSRLNSFRSGISHHV